MKKCASMETIKKNQKSSFLEEKISCKNNLTVTVGTSKFSCRRKGCISCLGLSDARALLLDIPIAQNWWVDMRLVETLTIVEFFSRQPGDDEVEWLFLCHRGTEWESKPRLQKRMLGFSSEVNRIIIAQPPRQCMGQFFALKLFPGQPKNLDKIILDGTLVGLSKNTSSWFLGQPCFPGKPI